MADSFQNAAKKTAELTENTADSVKKSLFEFMNGSDDFQKGTKKTIDLTLQTAKMTNDILKKALSELMNGSAAKKGKMSLKQLESKSGEKLESIEVTENNIGDFLNTARKYDVDFALKRDRSTSPPTYHVFFQTSKAENFQRAFSEYASIKGSQIERKKAPFDRQKLKERAKEIANKPLEKIDKSHEKHKEISL